MKISYNWLKEYVDIKLKPEQLAEKLTMSGSEVTTIEKIGSDYLLELEITPNRPDCLSYIGIAREVAAVTGRKLKLPQSTIHNPRSTILPKVTIMDKDLCPKYTARIIKGVKVGPSPKWLVEKIEKMGLRPVNNIVDISNFVLFETGQPLHAFDYDKLKGGEIIVRRAKKDEKITTIDRDAKTLQADTLVIADAQRPIAIGGVMGALNSEVTDSTTNILLESAYFSPVSIRKTSRSLGLTSESSYRFERSVDLGGVIPASDRAASLILELSGGQAGSIKDAGKSAQRQKEISLSLLYLKSILGCSIPSPSVKKILTSLSLTVKTKTKDKLSIKIPSTRQDLKSDIDIVEEIARIYGYNNFPSTIPTIVGHAERRQFERKVNDLTRETLISLGLNEIITYSLIAGKFLEGLDVNPAKIIKIKNPLSREQEIMRPTLIPGLLSIISRNLNRRLKNQKIFELGKAYFKDGKKFEEEHYLSIAITGESSTSWHDRRKVDFFDLKGIIQTLFDRLQIAGVNFVGGVDKSSPLSEGGTLLLTNSNKTVGIIGKLKKEVLDRFDISTEVIICQIEIGNLLKLIKLKKRFSKIIKYPSVTRDLSIIIDEKIVNANIMSIIKKIGGTLVKKVEFFDQYHGDQIPSGKKGLSYSIEYQAKNRTLTDVEINKLHSEIRTALIEKLSAQIR